MEKVLPVHTGLFDPFLLLPQLMFVIFSKFIIFPIEL